MASGFDKSSESFEAPPVEKAKKYLNKSDRVLDYGCATGAVSFELSDCAKKIVGIDISPKMIEFAKKKLRKKNVEFIQASISDVRGKFDVVVGFNILHLVEEEVIEKIGSLLPKRGLFISSTYCSGEKSFRNTLLRILLFPLMKLGLIPEMKSYKVSELKELLISNGFEIAECESLEEGSNCFIVGKKI